MKKQIEYTLKIIIYTLLFCFIHSSNVINYLKPNTEENEIYNKNVHLNATDFIDFATTLLISIINIFTSYKLSSSSFSRLYGIDSIGIESLLVHISLSIYEIFYQILMEKKWLILIHHLIVIFGLGYFVYNNFVQYYLNTFGLAEITNLFLVPFLLMKRNKLYLNKIFYIGLGLGITFIFARILLMPYMLYKSTVDIDNVPPDMLTKYYMGQLASLIVILMSLFWFYKLCKGGIKEYKKL